MKTNYVLIDYEIVQPEISTALVDDHLKLLDFIGANQPRIDVDVAAALLRLGPRAEYMRISGAGRNALDFHIAYCPGRMACADRDAYFHVIALDEGYEALLEHLKTQGIHAARRADVKDIPIVRTNGAAPTEDKLSIILAYLVRRGAQRPGTVKTLTGSEAALFQPKLQVAGFGSLLKKAQRNGIFVVGGTTITYALPESLLEGILAPPDVPLGALRLVIMRQPGTSGATRASSCGARGAVHGSAQNARSRPRTDAGQATTKNQGDFQAW